MWLRIFIIFRDIPVPCPHSHHQRWSICLRLCGSGFVPSSWRRYRGMLFAMKQGLIKGCWKHQLWCWAWFTGEDQWQSSWIIMVITITIMVFLMTIIISTYFNYAILAIIVDTISVVIPCLLSPLRVLNNISRLNEHIPNLNQVIKAKHQRWGIANNKWTCFVPTSSKYIHLALLESTFVHLEILLSIHIGTYHCNKVHTYVHEWIALIIITIMQLPL